MDGLKENPLLHRLLFLGTCRFNWIMQLLQILFPVFTIVVVLFESAYPSSVWMTDCLRDAFGGGWSTKSSWQTPKVGIRQQRQRRSQERRMPKWCWFKEVEIKSWILLKFHFGPWICRSFFSFYFDPSMANSFLFKWAVLELKILMKINREWESVWEESRRDEFSYLKLRN